MKKEVIEKRYNELVKEIEGKIMYDGRGKVDRYTCDKCGHIIYTTYRDKGVTIWSLRMVSSNTERYSSNETETISTF